MGGRGGGRLYFKLLLCDVTAAGLQELQHVGDQVPAAEVVGPQRGEEHTLGFAPHLCDTGGESRASVLRVLAGAGGTAPHLAVGAGGQAEEVSQQVPVDAPEQTAFHRQLAKLH